MNRRFRELVETLEPQFQALVRKQPIEPVALPRTMPKRGIYLFSERGRHLYVGRTNSLRQRIQNHARPCSNHNSATFAFRLARKATGRVKASYRSSGSRTELERDLTFGPAFARAKARIRRMELRFIEETDATRQALLEIYCATVLKTPYNDFENH